MFPVLHGIGLNPTGLSKRELQTLELSHFSRLLSRFPDMYRRFRLSAHGKNEFRKAREARLEQGVTIVTLGVETAASELNYSLCVHINMIYNTI